MKNKIKLGLTLIAFVSISSFTTAQVVSAGGYSTTETEQISTHVKKKASIKKEELLVTNFLSTNSTQSKGRLSLNKSLKSKLD